MPPEVHYPDVTAPPGWPYFRQGLQIRLVPPGMTLELADALVVISPLVPRQDNLPPADKLVEAAIFTEARQRFEIVSQKGPTSLKALSGLEGVSYDVVGYVRPRFPRERRLYVMYSDSLCYYAISYLAAETAYDEHLDAFWKSAKSMRPFRGLRLPPASPSPVATLYSD